jgi:hypothetical protein
MLYPVPSDFDFIGRRDFSNQSDWIIDAISWALTLYGAADMDVRIVSDRAWNPAYGNQPHTTNRPIERTE